MTLWSSGKVKHLFARESRVRPSEPTPVKEVGRRQISFVAGRRGAVLEDDFYNKLERLIVKAS